jgi:hypothetical protein
VERRFDTVHTARLVMRRWRQSGREPYAAMNAGPEVMRYYPARADRAASDAAIDRMEDLFDRQGFRLVPSCDNLATGVGRDPLYGPRPFSGWLPAPFASGPVADTAGGHGWMVRVNCRVAWLPVLSLPSW